MRRLTAVSTTTFLVTAALLAGCQQESPRAEASFAPTAGVCHRTMPQKAEPYEPMDCFGPHETETVHVGTFEGKDATLGSTPANGSPAQLRAYQACDSAVRAFVGGDWREARLIMRLLMPSKDGWAAGQRWFRCDLTEMLAIDFPDPNGRTGTLKGALGRSTPLRLTCFNPESKLGQIQEMVPASCTAPHTSEFGGVWTAPDGRYGDLAGDAMDRGCADVLARFANVPNDGDLEYRFGTITYGPDEQQWEAGERGVRCFLWLEDRKVSRSLKSAGVNDLPVVES
ncbi:hypothetical protein GCM10027290_51950 [Micromonospora sonneratiae]|uniref:Septum formation family protein n=1 Tax=Micromonospora sonneratiae TaxID=1184706 RepID=A0ABW3Y9E4_9ACTN